MINIKSKQQLPEGRKSKWQDRGGARGYLKVATSGPGLVGRQVGRYSFIKNEYVDGWIKQKEKRAMRGTSRTKDVMHQGLWLIYKGALRKAGDWWWEWHRLERQAIRNSPRKRNDITNVDEGICKVKRLLLLYPEPQVRAMNSCFFLDPRPAFHQNPVCAPHTSKHM